MGLILAIVIAIGTLLISVLIIFGGSMSDSPGSGMSPWPTLIGGLLLAAILAFTHFHSINW